MSFGRAAKYLCGFAGGAVVLAAAGTAALNAEELLGRAGDAAPGRPSWRWKGIPVLRAAQPVPAWAPASSGWDDNWDKRDLGSQITSKKTENNSEETSTEVDSGKPKATRHIFLIRHSQYNLNGSEDKDRVLTPLGREQAELTGQRLATLGLKYNILIHSSMARATETAHIISKYLPGVELVSCDLLREGAPIEPVPAISHWKPDAAQYHEDGARIEAAFRRYIHRADAKQKEDSYEIIVCHANVIRYFVCRALQFPPEGWLRMGLNNGSITWLTVRPNGRVALRALGDSGFMPPDKVTRT
ncbi:serine/threonine-protein phosphatase PGAM5, mitochondrial [Paramormyrops kingsleyae]|uniref:Serine/threonine-protein phosphatase PGAM5, mitochondrial n=1 Tax=Paramormyrops kingsleyae TaxID=1676925 RepID=A0A3B3SDI8_9TELE|nr:serine/threonine-protein phosphatase PGAM5, mitochondrial isoform X1 [Paramormyrops kingsleyae]